MFPIKCKKKKEKCSPIHVHTICVFVVLLCLSSREAYKDADEEGEEETDKEAAQGG